MKRPLAFFILFLCCGIILTHQPRPQILPLFLKGKVISEPVKRAGKTTFVLESGYGDIFVVAKEGVSLCYGDEVVVRAGVRRGQALHIEDERDIVAIRNRAFVLKKISLAFKNKAKKVFQDCLSGPSAGILEAMVLGDKTDVPWLVNRMMMRTGTVHILVVSGFNVGIIAFLALLLLKIVRFPRRLRPVLIIPILVIYCFLTGSSSPVVRATVMGVVFLLSYCFRREPDIYTSLGLAAFLILTFSPLQLFDIGFQLSFSSVLAIVCFYPRLKNLFSIKARVVRFFLDNLLVSFSAWMGTAGLIAYYFRIFSPVTVFANIIIVPLATLITVCGFTLLASRMIYPPCAHFFSLPCELLAILLLEANTFLAGLPFAYIRW